MADPKSFRSFRDRMAGLSAIGATGNAVSSILNNLANGIAQKEALRQKNQFEQDKFDFYKENEGAKRQIALHKVLNPAEKTYKPASAPSVSKLKALPYNDFINDRVKEAKIADPTAAITGILTPENKALWTKDWIEHVGFVTDALRRNEEDAKQGKSKEYANKAEAINVLMDLTKRSSGEHADYWKNYARDNLANPGSRNDLFDSLKKTQDYLSARGGGDAPSYANTSRNALSENVQTAKVDTAMNSIGSVITAKGLRKTSDVNQSSVLKKAGLGDYYFDPKDVVKLNMGAKADGLILLNAPGGRGQGQGEYIPKNKLFSSTDLAKIRMSELK